MKILAGPSKPKNRSKRLSIQLSTYGNLLVIPGVEIQDIEKAQAGNRSSLGNVEKRIKELDQKLQAVNLLRLQTEEQQSLNEKQFAQITTETVEDAEAKELSKTLRILARQLGAKKSLLENLTALYSQAIKELEDVQTAMSVLTDKFEQEVKKLKKQELFTRRELPLVTAHWNEVEQELTHLKTQFQQMGTTTFWMHELRPVWDSGVYLRSLFFLILFLATIIFLFRLRRFCDGLMLHPFYRQQPWRSLPLQILYRSLPLLGMTVFLSLYSYFHHLNAIPLFSTVLDVFWLLVLTKWPFDFLSLFNQTSLHQLPVPIVFRLRFY